MKKLAAFIVPLFFLAACADKTPEHGQVEENKFTDEWIQMVPGGTPGVMIPVVHEAKWEIKINGEFYEVPESVYNTCWTGLEYPDCVGGAW